MNYWKDTKHTYKIFDHAILALTNLPWDEYKLFSALISYMNKYNILVNKHNDEFLTTGEIQSIVGFDTSKFDHCLNNLIKRKILGIFNFNNTQAYVLNPYICIRDDVVLVEVDDYFSNSSWAKLAEEYVM